MTALRAYLELTKPRLLPLVLLSGLPAFWLAAGGRPSPALLVATLGGTVLAAGAANALNSWLERDRDALMERTAARPLPAGKLSPPRALAFGLALGVAGCASLWIFASPSAALIALAAILVYVFAYTIWLKPRTTAAVIVGGIAGAIAPLIADAAIDGRVGAAGLALFAIVFAWQPPHFHAITLYRTRDYERAGFPTLAARIGAASTSARILRWTWLLVATSLAPVPLLPFGWPYAAAALGLGAWLLARALALRRRPDETSARAYFLATLAHLFGLFAAMIAEIAAAEIWS